MAVYESKKPTKDGRKYFFRIKYKDIFGEVHDYTSPKFKNKKDAVSEEAKKRIKLNDNKVIVSSITFKQIYNEWIIKKENEIKRQTIIKLNFMVRHLKCIENTKINDFNLAKYNQYRNYLASLKHSTIYNNKILGILKQLIKYSNKYYGTNDEILKFIEPFRNVNEIKKEMQFYTYEEYKKFSSVIEDHNWKIWFDMLYYLGLRCGECQALQFKDINFNKKTISISKTLTTKIKGENWTISSPKTSNSIRVLPIPKKLLEGLELILEEAKKCKDYSSEWFIFGFSIPFKENTITIRKNKYCKLANLKQIRIHDFRHSCASFLINYCHASISLVSKYLGHSNISITLNTYTHMYKSELEDITKIINNL